MTIPGDMHVISNLAASALDVIVGGEAYGMGRRRAGRVAHSLGFGGRPRFPLLKPEAFSSGSAARTSDRIDTNQTATLPRVEREAAPGSMSGMSDQLPLCRVGRPGLMS